LNFIAAFAKAGNPEGLAMSQTAVRNQFLSQVNVAIEQAESDPWGFGEQ
jgi:endoglucanase